jgi:multidrug efflux pump subunit AcrB
MLQHQRSLRRQHQVLHAAARQHFALCDRDGEVGFTILSISISLIAVFIPI